MTDPEFAAEIIGKRYGTDFRVVFIDCDGTVTLLMHGDHYKIALAELRTIVERGFVAEMPEVTT